MNISEMLQPKVTFGNLSQPSRQVQKTPALKADRFEPKFSGLTDEKYSVTMRWSDPINSDVVSAVYRNLLLQDLILTENNDNSSLQLNLDSVSNQGFPLTTEAALSDSMQLLNRPVDVVAKTIASGVGLKALQSATGKRLMHDGAYINMAVAVGGNPYARNDDMQIRKELKNEYVREIEQILMDRAGVSREEAFESIQSSRNLNPLESLYYGKNGLVDGVLVGYDQVVTRDELMAYLEKPGRFESEDDIEAFLRMPQNIKKLDTQDLTAFSSESAGLVETDSKRPPLYKSLKGMVEEAQAEQAKAAVKAQAQSLKKKQEKAATDKFNDVKKFIKDLGKKAGQDQSAEEVLKTLDSLTTEPEQAEEEKAQLTMFQMQPDGKIAAMPAGKLPLNLTVKLPQITPSRTEFNNLPEERSYLQDDVIYFNDGFNDASAEQIIGGLLTLDAKKSAQDDASNIKMVVNSPGGAVIAGNDITSTIRRLKTPVDMVVNGMAASCGAWLIASVTGNRYMTPGAKIMIHDALSQYPNGTAKELNESYDNIHQMTDTFVKTVADRVGRSFDATYEDFKHDIWFNPLEALFYGKNGLIDGILVQDKVVTKDQVEAFLLDYVGGDEKALKKLIRDRISSLREGKREWRPSRHDENDPFENAYRVIMELAKDAKPMAEIEQFAASTSRAQDSIDTITVKV